MKKRHGSTITKQVKLRWEQLKASPNFSEYLTLGLGKPHKLEGDLAGNYAVSVSGNIRIILSPLCDDFLPETLSKCDVVVLRGLCDYHGGKVEWIIP